MIDPSALSVDPVNLHQTPAIGSLIAGRYRVEGFLGEGGMGVVLRATQLTNGRPVALKILTAEAAAISETVARFRQEATIASRIRNVHVVSVLDVDEADDGRQFIVMELLEGIDFASLIEQRGALPTQEAVGLVLQACAGVATAHAQGLIHRDLKPANLFLARREGLPPIVKVLDFGISRSLNARSARLTHQSMALGTPMYMAPEQIVSTRDVDARCDQHAIGMVLFELLTGRPPYDPPNAAALAIAIATHPPPSARALRPELPVRLDLAIQRALAKRPGDRFADVGQLARAIVAFAPSGAGVFAQMIEATLAPLRSTDLESAPTVQMNLPASLLPDPHVRQSARPRELEAFGAGADEGAPRPAREPRNVQQRSPEHAAVTVTASPVSTDPRGRVLARHDWAQTALLLGGVALGVIVVGGVTFAVVSAAGGRNASSPSDPDRSATVMEEHAPTFGTTAPRVEPRLAGSIPKPATSAGARPEHAPSSSATGTPSAMAPPASKRPPQPSKKPIKKPEPQR